MKAFISIGVAAALLMAGCGDSDGDTTAGGDTTTGGDTATEGGTTAGETTAGETTGGDEDATTGGDTTTTTGPSSEVFIPPSTTTGGDTEGGTMDEPVPVFPPSNCHIALQCNLDCATDDCACDADLTTDENTQLAGALGCLEEKSCLKAGALQCLTDDDDDEGCWHVFAPCATTGTGTEVCKNVLDCSRSCDSEDSKCINDCVATGQLNAQRDYVILENCIKEYCQTNPEDTNCVKNGEDNLCGNKYQACITPN